MASKSFVSAVDALARQLVGGPPRKGPDLARWLARLSEFDKAQGWFGFRSCALVGGAVFDNGAWARGYVRVARKLEELPRVERALFDGRMSYAKVAMVCRVATADSEKHVLRVALSLRDDDFALVIAELEATRRRWAVVPYDPDKAEPSRPAESGGGALVSGARPRPASDRAPRRATVGSWVGGRGPPALARSCGPVLGPRPLRPHGPECFDAPRNTRSARGAAIFGVDTSPSSRSVPASRRYVTCPLQAKIARQRVAQRGRATRVATARFE